MSRISRGLQHLSRIWLPARNVFPREILDAVLPVTDALGSSRLSEVNATFFTPSQATFVNLLPPGQGEFQIIKHASVFVDSSVATTIGFHLRHTQSGLRINVEDDRAVPSTGADGFEVALLSPVIVPTGYDFGVHNRILLVAPNAITVRFVHLTLPAGEIIPHFLQK